MAFTYTGTPSQRIEQAQQRISDDSIVQNTMLSSYLSAAKSQAEQTATIQAEPKAEKKWYERLGDTLGDVAKSVFTGFTKAFEGLADFGASTIGVIAGWAGNDELKQRVSDWTERDLAGTEMWDAMRNSGLNVDFESSWINDLSGTAQNIIRGVGSGVGQMLPMLALTLVTGGAAGAATAGAVTKGTMTAAKAAKIVSGVSKATKAVNLAGLGMSAAGSATENALNQTVLDENGKQQEVELDRAYLYGLASGAVEVATEKLVGGPFEKMTGSGLADRLINRLGKSSAFGKAVKVAAGYVGEGVEEMVSEAVSGSLQKIYDDNADTSPDVEKMFEAGVIGSLTAMALGTSGQVINKASNVQTVQDAMLDVENIDKRAASLKKNGKLDEERLTRLEEERKKKIDTISKRYARASERSQQRMRATLPQLADMLNEDGTVKEIALEEGAADITAAQASGAMSGDLALSRRRQVANTLHQNNLSIAENITEDETTDAGWFAEALDRLVGRESGIKSKYVVVDGMQDGNDAFQDGDITYVSRKIFTDSEENGVVLTKQEKMARAFAHETDHFAEGSVEYIKLHAVMKELGITDMAIADMRASVVGDDTRTVADAYGIGSDVIDAIAEGKDTSGLNQAQVRLALDEIRAKETEILYGNKEMIDKLVSENRNIAKKILGRIKMAVKELGARIKGDTEEVKHLKLLKSAEKLFSDSLAEAGQGYMRKKNNSVAKNVEHRDAGNSVRNTIRGYDNDGHVRSDFDEFINSLSSVDKWLAENITYEEWMEILKEDAVLESNMERDSHQQKFLHMSKQEIRDAYIKKLYDSGKLNALVTKMIEKNPQMKEFFKNSKMNGRFNPSGHGKNEYIVMFHGSENNFTKFDSSKVGKNGTVKGSGFYFIANMEYAQSYSSEDGRVYAVLLNIEKPLSYSSHNMTKAELKRFLTAVVDTNGTDYLSNFEDVNKVGYDKLLNIAVDQLFEYNSNDAAIIEEVFVSSRMEYNQFFDGLIQTTGYDGVIMWNRAEGTTALVFHPNQIKEIFNTSPTNDSDIRYSIRGRDSHNRIDLRNSIELLDFTEREEYNIITTKDSYFGAEISETEQVQKFDFIINHTSKLVKNLFKSPMYLDLTLKDIEVISEIYDGRIVSYDILSKLDIIEKAQEYNATHGVVLALGEQPNKSQLNNFELVCDKFLKSAENCSRDKKAQIIIGLPSSGKSSAIAAKLLYDYNAFEFDSDTIKSLMKEFDNGKGANACQSASTWIADNLAMSQLIDDGVNLVIPIVGKSVTAIRKKLDPLRKAGYVVDLYSVVLPKEKALCRATTRFVETGRYVPLDYIQEGIEQSVIDAAYKVIIESGEVSNYDRLNNDVPRGEKAISERNNSKKGLDGTTEKRSIVRNRDSETGYGLFASDRGTYQESKDGQSSIQLHRVSRLTSEESNVRFSKRGTIKHEELLKSLNGMQLDYFGRAYAKIDTPSKFFDGDERNARLAAQIEQMSTLGIAEQTKYADDLASAIIRNMVMTDVSPDEIDALMHDANIVNYYRKKLNIKSLLPEIESKYGKETARGIVMQWQAPKGENGIGVDTIVEEMRADGLIINSTNEADIFFEMIDILDKTREKTEKVLNKHVGEVLSEEEQNALRDELRENIIDFMQEHGADADWAANYKDSRRQMKKMLDNAKARATAILDQAVLQAQQIEERAVQEGRNYKKQLALEQQQFEAGMHEDLEFYKAQKDAEVRDVVQAVRSEAADSVSYMVKVQHATDDAYSAAVSLSKMERKKYHNVNKVWNEPWETLISQLSGVKYRGVLRKYGSRKIITEFGEKWYNIDNQVLNGGLTHEEALAAFNDPNATHVGYLDKHVLRAINYLRENLERPLKAGKNKGQMTENNYDLTYYELRAVECVLNGAKRIMEKYDRVNISLSETVTLSETASNDTSIADAISGHVRSKFRAVRSTESLIRQIITPDAILAEMFGHDEKATLPKIYRFLLDGVTEGQRAQIEMDNIIEDFLREHKSYEKHFNNDKITIAGHELPVYVAIDLIMTSRDAQSWDSLIDGGWGYWDSHKDWHNIGKFTIEQIEDMTKGLEQRDKECLEMLRKFYNVSTKYTIEGQKRADGSSVLEREINARYYPRSIYSGDVANVIEDKPTLMSILTPGFLKERVKHKHRLAGRNAFERARMHSKAVGQYYGTALPMKELQRLYNCNVGEEGRPTRTIRTIINEQSWNGFDEWFTNLLEDIQGTRKGKDSLGNKIVDSARGKVIKAILSVNLKSIMSQIAGYPAAFTYLNGWSMTRSLGKIHLKESFNSMMKYCNWAYVKHYSGGAVLAQTLTEKFNKATDIGTIGMQGMDTLLNVMIWNACQIQVETNHKGNADFAFGTEANMKEAAVLHTTIGIKTQGNSAKGEQTAMQRSTNPIIKTFAAFNSDGFKMISRLYEGIDKLRALRYLEQHGHKVDAKTKSDAKKFAAKATTALLVSNLVYTLIAELYNLIVNKDREEDDEGNEEAWNKAFGMNYLSALVGNIPVLRDVFDYFVDGYEVKDYALGGFNDILTAMGDTFGMIDTLAKGEAYDTKDIAAPLKSLLVSLGTAFGLPTRNVYNLLYGLTKRFDEGAAYEWNSVFYNSNYASDLNKAISDGDTDLQTTIVGLMLDDNGMTDTSAKVNNKLRDLYAEGLSVLPRSVSESFSFDGEVYKMTERQRKAFKAVYRKANDEVESLINNKALDALPKEVQAKAIKWIYDFYYESAVYATVGEEPDSKKQLFGETMDISKFAMTVAACAAVETTIDKKGNVVAGSRKATIQKLLNQLSLTSSERLIVLAYLGYSVEEDASKVKSYISRIGLTKRQQKMMLDYCGLAA